MIFFEILRTYGFLVLIPGIVAGLSFALKSASGAYWHHYDASYPYLLNALSFATGKPVFFIDHPGTSLHILGGVVIYVLNLGRAAPDIVDRVLGDPEFYLHVIHAVLLLVFFATSVFLVLYVYRKTQDKIAVLVTQFPVLFVLAVKSYSIPVLANVGPELLMMSIINVFIVLFFRLSFSDESKEDWSMVVWLGFLCGMGAATKLTFLSLAVVPLVVFPWRQKIAFLFVSLVFFILWTLPACHRYSSFLALNMARTTHTGAYGGGRLGFIDISAYVGFLKVVLKDFWPVILVVCGAFLWSSWVFIKGRRDRGVRILWAAALGVLVHLGLIAARYYFPHYIVPGLFLSGLVFLLFYLLYKPRYPRVIGTVVLIVFVLMTFRTIRLCEEQSRLVRQAETFQKNLHMKYPGYLFIPSYAQPALEKAYAFSFSSDGSGKEHLDVLSRRYPLLVIYDPVEYIIWNHSSRLMADDILGRFPGVMFVGPEIDFSQGPHIARLMEHEGPFYAYLLTGSTEKQANLLFIRAQVLLSQKDYLTAIAFASKSRELGFHPKEKVESLIKEASSYFVK